MQTRLVPIEGAGFGREVRHWDPTSEIELRDALHEHGVLLFRGLTEISSVELGQRVEAMFPSMPLVRPKRNLPPDGGPMNVLGSTRNEAGEFNADYVPAATVGAPLLSADGQWDEDLENSLMNWVRGKEECTFMEWHTDATFNPWPTSYAALYCRQAGGSHTGYACARRGFQDLPDDLKALAEQAICRFRPSIIYGNRELGIPAIGSRAVQLDAVKSGNYVDSSEEDGSLEKPPHPDDPVVHHRLVQTHPHTRERSLRFSLKALETLVGRHGSLDGIAPTDAKRLAWQIMRQATRGERAYLHEWREGDLIVWDERLTQHCRVPYDATNVREMWRLVFEHDPAEQEFNEIEPQQNLTLAAN